MDRYDGTLQQFVETTKEPDLQQLEWLAWLVRTGRLVGDTAPIDREAGKNHD